MQLVLHHSALNRRRDHVQSLARRVDDRCAGDPDLRRDQPIARLRQGGDVRTQKIPFPDRRCRLAIRVECINTVVLGRGVNDVLI